MAVPLLIHWAFAMTGMKRTSTRASRSRERMARPPGENVDGVGGRRCFDEGTPGRRFGVSTTRRETVDTQRALALMRILAPPDYRAITIFLVTVSDPAWTR